MPLWNFGIVIALLAVMWCAFGKNKSNNDIATMNKTVESNNWTTRIFNLINTRSDTIWVGAQNLVASPGWSIPPGDTVSLTVDGDAASCTIWAGIGCDAQGNNCKSGGKTAPEAPVSVIEFTLHSTGTNVDYFDLSFVSGWNCGIGVEPFDQGGHPICGDWGCTKFSYKNVPPELFKIVSGDTVGVFSICKAIYDPTQLAGSAYLQSLQNQGCLVCCACQCTSPYCTSPNCCYCCTPYQPISSCPTPNCAQCDLTLWPKASNGVGYPAVFKSQCVIAYSWPFDDATSTLRCRGNYNLFFYEN